MSFDEAKRERIKTYLLEKVDVDDKYIVSKVADAFGISLTSVKRYIDSLISEGIIEVNKDTQCGYSIISLKKSSDFEFVKGKTLEDRIYSREVAPIIDKLPDNVAHMWSYSISEMLNNCIEHSKGDKGTITIKQNYLYTDVYISDNGVGAFQTILDCIKEYDDEATYEDAYLELVKGKFTSDTTSHSGEGIFFTSRFCDKFYLSSNGVVYSREDDNETFFRDRLLAYMNAFKKIGTVVGMRIYNNSVKNTMDVFDSYSTVDDGIYKTEIPLVKFCDRGDPVARSLAKRICYRLDSFSEVVMDFTGVSFMGQGFADEMFRVYLTAHPDVHFSVINANENVIKMLRHVGYKDVPKI